MSKNDSVDICIGCGRETTANLTTKLGSIICRQCFNEIKGQGHVRVEDNY